MLRSSRISNGTSFGCCLSSCQDSPALLEHGWLLLALVTTPDTPVVLSPAPLLFAPPTPAQGSKGSIGHRSHASSSLLMHASLANSCNGDPPSVPLGLGTSDSALHAFPVAPPIWGPASLSSQWPNPDGSEGTTFSMRGGRHVYGGQFSLGQFPGPNHGGTPTFNPSPGPCHGGFYALNPGQGFPSPALTNEYGWSFNFPGGVHTPVPWVVFGGGHSHHSSHVNHPHAHASVASMLASVASPLCPFAQKNFSSASNVSMSFWHTVSAAVAANMIGGGVPPTTTV
jgi:hypothetical protein